MDYSLVKTRFNWSFTTLQQIVHVILLIYSEVQLSYIWWLFQYYMLHIILEVNNDKLLVLHIMPWLMSTLFIVRKYLTTHTFALLFPLPHEQWGKQFRGRSHIPGAASPWFPSLVPGGGSICKNCTWTERTRAALSPSAKNTGRPSLRCFLYAPPLLSLSLVFSGADFTIVQLLLVRVNWLTGVRGGVCVNACVPWEAPPLLCRFQSSPW